MNTQEQADMSDITSKRILCAQDLSCFGHTSLMAEIAILYRLGIQVVALPTAVLSANTDFAGYRMLDTTSQMEDFSRQWHDWQLDIDAIHRGFLASPQQAAILKDTIQAFQKPGMTVLVDPVFGDGGKLYSCFELSMVDAMRELVRVATIITPNVTEAALLLDENPQDANPDKCQEWAKRLHEWGPRHVVITSAPASQYDIMQTLHYDGETNATRGIPFPVIDGAHPGSGDCFAAFLLAGIVNGYSVESSLIAATKIMTMGLQMGVPKNRTWREGIALELLLQKDLESYYTQAGGQI